MKKLNNIYQVAKITKQKKAEGKKIGLITGCFDIIHVGHIELFRFAKKHVDFLIVGLENDETIRLSKGKGRPINKFADRCEVLDELKSIDVIFPIDLVVTFGKRKVAEKYLGLIKRIMPDYLITTLNVDKYWIEKVKVLKTIGVKLLKNKKTIDISSSKIIQKIKEV